MQHVEVPRPVHIDPAFESESILLFALRRTKVVEIALDVLLHHRAQFANYRFFDAPIGLLFFLDRDLEQGSWVDMGMFIQNVMLAALGHGLATCPQASLAEFPDLVRSVLELPDKLALVCGMSLGYPDPDAPVNRYRTSREPVSSFRRWYD